MTRATHPRLERAMRTSGRWVCVLGLMASVAAGTARADGAGATQRENNQPWVSLKLSDLGVPAISDAFVKAGSSMLTLNIIDDRHLLVTFGTRGLVPRIPDDPPDDEDRMVAAEVVELPTGKILARTEWHMHDHGRYLWRLGKGRFLVRSRNTLFTITPGALLNTPDPLRAGAFPDRPGMPVLALLSPDASLAMVETELNPPNKAEMQAAAAVNGDAPERRKPEVVIDFYRLKGGDAAEPELSLIHAGSAKSPALLALPLDGDGYLWPADGRRGSWGVSFNEYGGRAVPVGSVLSSCPPRLQLVSRSEYVAFACMGTDRLKMEAFGMDGHEVWEEPLGSVAGLPAFAFAPQAGRFAINRISSIITDPEALAMVPETATQEVRVYQTESGDLLLRAPESPVMKGGENFDLSEDGMLAAVVNAGAVQVYKLRPLSAQDEKDLKLAASFSPPPGDGPVNLMKLAKAEVESAGPGEAAEAASGGKKPEVKPAVETGAAPAKTETAASGAGGNAAGAGGAGTLGAGAGGAGAPAARAGAAEGSSGEVAAAAADATAAGAGVSGDASAEPGAGPRKPPTLLSPGETAEYHPGGSGKQGKPE